jgi:arabinosaccharide transport system substrate-binding protein
MRRALLALAVLALAGLTRDAQAAEKRKVTLWSFAQNNVDEYVKRKAEVEKKFDIELDIQVVPQDAFVQKLQAVMKDGQGAPDAIEWMIENNRILNANPKKSLVIPLDEYVAKSAEFKKVVPGRVAWVTYGGHTYGLPHDVHPVILIYNDTLWKAVGVDVAKIETWDEFFEASKKLTAEKKDGKPLHYALPSGNDGLGNTMFMIWQQTGSQILDKDGKPTFTSPEFSAYVTKWFDWYKTGAFTAWDWGNFKALLANGTLASYTSPDWWVPQVTLAATGVDGDSKVEKKYEFRIRSLPVYKKGGPTSASWGGSFMAIPKTTKDPAFVYKVIEYLEYDPGALKARWETSMLPPFQEVWSDPMFQAPDSQKRFGGQSLGQIMIAGAKTMPKINSGDIFWDAINDFGEQYTEMATGKVSVADGLKKVQDKAQARFEAVKK